MHIEHTAFNQSMIYCADSHENVGEKRQTNGQSTSTAKTNPCWERAEQNEHATYQYRHRPYEYQKWNVQKIVFNHIEFLISQNTSLRKNSPNNNNNRCRCRSRIPTQWREFFFNFFCKLLSYPRFVFFYFCRVFRAEAHNTDFQLWLEIEFVCFRFLWCAFRFNQLLTFLAIR